MAEYFHEKTIDSATTMFPLNLRNMPSPSTLFSAYASMSASVVLFKSMFNQLVPLSLRHKILSTLRLYFKPRSPLLTLVIEESAGMRRNELFDASEIYLCSKTSPQTDRLKISKTPNDKNLTTAFAQSEKIVDSFDGVELKWRFLRDEKSSWTSDPHQVECSDGNHSDRKQWFELSFGKEHRDSVLGSYLPFVVDKAKEISESRKVVKLHTILNSSYSNTKWESIEFEHPSTFDTIAMDAELKKDIIDDLDRFVKRREFYRKVGKAWKRGYLLYGPPGTGKSSLIAAMANYLKFDVYDLQLANLSRDSELRKVLLSTGNRSILVVEDIDCSTTNKFPDRMTSKFGDHNASVQFTLSGLLNFIDGLWSSCGDERIIIFTTNYKEKLDPALLRPGRMDMHIHLSYCTIDGFKVLASNYLDIPANDRDDPHHHELIGKVEELMGSTQVTPAQVAEELMKSDNASVSLQGLVNFLKRKRTENNGTTAEEIEQESNEVNKEDTGSHEIGNEAKRQKIARS